MDASPLSYGTAAAGHPTPSGASVPIYRPSLQVTVIFARCQRRSTALSFKWCSCIFCSAVLRKQWPLYSSNSPIVSNSLAFSQEQGLLCRDISGNGKIKVGSPMSQGACMYGIQKGLLEACRLCAVHSRGGRRGPPTGGTAGCRRRARRRWRPCWRGCRPGGARWRCGRSSCAPGSPRSCFSRLIASLPLPRRCTSLVDRRAVHLVQGPLQQLRSCCPNLVEQI